MSAITVMRDRYDEAICERCGHKSAYHDTSECRAPIFASGFDLNVKPPCDCAGWRRDSNWPPSIIIRADQP